MLKHWSCERFKFRLKYSVRYQ